MKISVRVVLVSVTFGLVCFGAGAGLLSQQVPEVSCERLWELASWKEPQDREDARIYNDMTMLASFVYDKNCR